MTVQASDQAASGGSNLFLGILRAAPRVLPAILFVLAVHFVALSDASPVSVFVLVGVCLGNAVIAGFGIRARASIPWLVLSGLMGLVLISVNGGPPILTNLVVLPAIAINALMLWVFGRTLRPGRMALIERMSHLDRGPLSLEVSAYTRRLTVAWTGFFAATTLVSVGLAWLGDLALWSWAMNFGVPAMAISFFLGEHAYRWRRFGSQTPVSPLRTIRAAMRPAAWTEDT